MTDTQPFILYFDYHLKSIEVLDIIVKKILKYSKFEYFLDSENFQDKIRNLPQIPDVVFLNIHLTPHNGYEILEWFLATPEYKDTKIIALTASVMVQDVAKFQESGFDGLIGKPLAHKVFPRLLEQILAGESIWYIP